MRTLILMSLLCWAATGLVAADPVAVFNEAMATQDNAAKKRAIQGLLGLPKDQDDVLLPLLVKAVDDRQAGSSAISALRSRTGLQPASGRGGNSGYPGYPSADTAAGWNAWLAARKADLDLKNKAKELEKKIEKLADKVDPDQPDDDTSASTGDSRTPQKLPPPTDLGGLDRIHFANGSTLLGYIISKRTDAEGQLVSIRVVHRDGAGEESISAELIARIDEDIE